MMWFLSTQEARSCISVSTKERKELLDLIGEEYSQSLHLHQRRNGGKLEILGGGIKKPGGQVIEHCVHHCNPGSGEERNYQESMGMLGVCVCV